MSSGPAWKISCKKQEEQERRKRLVANLSLIVAALPLLSPLIGRCFPAVISLFLPLLFRCFAAVIFAVFAPAALEKWHWFQGDKRLQWPVDEANRELPVLASKKAVQGAGQHVDAEQPSQLGGQSWRRGRAGRHLRG